MKQSKLPVSTCALTLTLLAATSIRADVAADTPPAATAATNAPAAETGTTVAAAEPEPNTIDSFFNGELT